MFLCVNRSNVLEHGSLPTCLDHAVGLGLSVVWLLFLFLTQLDRGLELREPCLELADTGFGGFLVGLLERVELLDDVLEGCVESEYR